MGTPLTVMVLESHQDAATRAVSKLTARGHTVRRCHEPGAPSFPCNGLGAGAGCPLDGDVDVALVVRRGVNPRPTGDEDGVTCALRAGLPLVEDGSDLLDPYAPMLTARVWAGDDVADVVERAANEGLAPLERELEEALGPFLRSADRPTNSVRVRAESAGRHLVLHLSGPQLHGTFGGLLGVRAADRARQGARRWESVEVTLTSTDTPVDAPA
jgi:hypothetical protein